MKHTVQRTIDEHQLIAKGQRICVAVSGGMDSMVLLHVLSALNYPCSVVHVDHGLRGMASDDDLAFVEQQAKAMGISFTSKRVDVMEKVKNTGQSKQMAARELRYAFFGSLVSNGHGDLIATAHHSDDNVETLLMGLMRGTGSPLPAGIPMKRGIYVRPLLHVTRREIKEYAEQHEIPFRSDASNTDPTYLRNRVRHELIPLMEAIQPGARSSIHRHMNYVAEAAETMRTAVERELESALNSEGEIQELSRKELMGSTHPYSTLHAWMQPHGFHPDEVERLLKAAKEEHVGAQFFSASHRITIDRPSILLGPIDPNPAPQWTIHEDLRIPNEADVACSMVNCGSVDLNAGPQVAWLDRSKLQFPLLLRPWRHGDRMVPWGMTGTKLISDMLIDAKVPRPQKERTYVLLSGGRIVWLSGHRIANGYGVEPSTEAILRVELLNEIR